MRLVLAGAILVAGCGARSSLSDVGPGSHSTLDASADVADAATCSPSTATALATAPLTLTASGLQTGRDVVSAPHVDGSFVYWVQLADSSFHDFWTNYLPEHIATVNRVPASGGAVQVVATFNARSDRRAIEVAYDLQYMYWAADPVGGPGETNGTIVRARHDGSDMTTIVGGLFRPGGVAVAGGKVYFTLEGTPSQVMPTTLHRVNTDGSGVEQVSQTNFVQFDTGNSVWTPDYVYVPFGGIIRFATPDWTETTVVGLDWDGGFASGPPALAGLSLDGITGLAITWSTPNQDQPAAIVRWSPVGGSFTTVVTGLTVGPSVGPWLPTQRTATDGMTAYATSLGKIVRAPLAGGPLETVGPATFTGGIAFDDAHVYWTSYDATTVTVYVACK